jgi:hypothetical protein
METKLRGYANKLFQILGPITKYSKFRIKYFWEKLNNFHSRLDYVTAMKRIRLENPSISLPELEALALEEVFNKAPKSRAYYRY